MEKMDVLEMLKRSRRYICHIFGLYEYAICLL